MSVEDFYVGLLRRFIAITHKTGVWEGKDDDWAELIEEALFYDLPYPGMLA